MKKLLYHLFCLLFSLSLPLVAQTTPDISESNPLDLTSMITNATCENAPGWQHHSGEQAGTGSSNYSKNVALFNSLDYAGAGIESWTANPVTNREIIFQDLSLPAGTYILEACVVAQVYISDTAHSKNDGGIFLFMGEEQTECTSNTWQRLTVKVTLEKEGTVRLGLKAGANNKNTWISLADVHLYMTAMSSETQSVLSLDENYDTYAVSKDLLTNVYLRKYLPADRYVPICLPISLSEQTASSVFKDIKSIKTLAQKDNMITFTTQPETTIEAGKVYLVKAKTTTDALTPLGMALVSASMPKETKIGNLTLYGTYRVREHISECYILNDTGNAFVLATGRTHIKGFGAYIK